MALPLYLALTAAEFQNCSSLPEHIGWMACHYSPYGLGISNRPDALPAGSMLIFNDRTPPCGHDPELITQQLGELVENFQCSSVLLDFQRPDYNENAAVAKAVTDALSCPVGVSELYAKELDCPVFLPPVPLTAPINEYLRPWQGREVWLEEAMIGERFTVTATDNTCIPLACIDQPSSGFCDSQLHCHYQACTFDNHIEFTLWRTKDDLNQLQQEAKSYHVTRTVGLFQEFKSNM